MTCEAGALWYNGNMDAVMDIAPGDNNMVIDVVLMLSLALVSGWLFGNLQLWMVNHD